MNKLNLTLISLIMLVNSKNVFAASILQSKNNKILISLDGDKLSVGQTITLKDADNNVVGTAVVNQVKGEKAIATIKTGKSNGNEIIELTDSTTAADPDEELISPDSYSKKSKSVYRLNSAKMAVLLNIGLNNMITKQADLAKNTEDVALKGSSLGLSGSIDYPFNNWLIMRGTLGYEPFSAAGSSNLLSCDNLTSKDCNALINYISAGGYARINFTKNRYQFWGALGGTGKFPMSKTSTALRTDDIKMTVTFGGALGSDFFVTNKSFIPISAEFQMFQNSDTVSANIILLRVGYGWAF